MKTRLLSVGIILGVLAVGALAEAPPPFVGTWKLDLAKSRFSPGPAPRSAVVRHEAIENGMRQVSDTVDAEGKAKHTEYSARFDGKEYPITGTDPAEVITLKRIDAYNTDWTTRSGTRIVSTGRASYSRDGKVRTLTYTGTTAKGEKVENTTVWDRH
jgi:hypothetical protein